MAQMKATRVAYGEALAELGKEDGRVVVLDADLAHATMTSTFAKAFPDRFFNMGIAEANLVGAAAGMSTMGCIPFCSTFAIFGACRAYEMIRNAVAYPHFNVKFGFTHGGISIGEDGGSHQSFEDIALMRMIPGMTVIVPCDANETRKAVYAAARMDGPVFLRMSRLPSPVLEPEMPFEVGKANVLKEGSRLALFACGFLVATALECREVLLREGIEIAVVNVHTIKPIDRECILAQARKCGKVATLEDHSVIGGLGDAVTDALRNQGSFHIEKIGIEDRFGQSGKSDELLAEYGLSTPKVLSRLRQLLAD